MLRPYIVVVPSVVIVPTLTDSALTVADDDNAVHVVGHDREANLTPAFLRNPSGRTEAHASRDHLSEHVATLLETNGHVVGSGARVIIPTEPDRLPVVRDTKWNTFVGHAANRTGPWRATGTGLLRDSSISRNYR